VLTKPFTDLQLKQALLAAVADRRADEKQA
jgi:hypothetical protein